MSYQIIRYRKGALDATDANLGYVIVDTGRLDIGMYEGMKGSYLSMSGRAAYLTYASGLGASSNGASFNQIHNNTDSANTQKTRQNGGKASIEKGVKGAQRI